MASEILMADVKRTLAALRNTPYAIFVDSKAAFSLAPRGRIGHVLADVDVLMDVLNLLASTLQENKVTIDDGLAKFIQTSGPALGGQPKRTLIPHHY